MQAMAGTPQLWETSLPSLLKWNTPHPCSCEFAPPNRRDAGVPECVGINGVTLTPINFKTEQEFK
jgi:hypothetical protein